MYLKFCAKVTHPNLLHVASLFAVVSAYSPGGDSHTYESAAFLNARRLRFTMAHGFLLCLFCWPPACRHVASQQRLGAAISGADPFHPFGANLPPLSPSLIPFLFLSPSFSYPALPSCRQVATKSSQEVRERCELPRWDPGRSPGRKPYLVYSEQRKCVSWQPFWFFPGNQNVI